MRDWERERMECGRSRRGVCAFEVSSFKYLHANLSRLRYHSTRSRLAAREDGSLKTHASQTTAFRFHKYRFDNGNYFLRDHFRQRKESLLASQSLRETGPLLLLRLTNHLKSTFKWTMHESARVSHNPLPVPLLYHDPANPATLHSYYFLLGILDGRHKIHQLGEVRSLC